MAGRMNKAGAEDGTSFNFTKVKGTKWAPILFLDDK
ncbi:hypothetical protein M2105_006226 [Paenibacillus sp. PastF-1]|nr:hypothetical protein [Paenibacillus sp. PastF-2]MDF9851736.1 hypothetical protein [Paenibacillus sp. PastM-2]MDF9858311.1 hypothetical protein [Paenibacillus sp. PastF-1]MDH6483609.1 hypothetical protein [Paenibacillus sp. PastH-2]MDH6510986.1 hypothetical protein [Paenibacillus sp. PastM-3]